MSFLTGIFGGGAAEVIKAVGEVGDEWFTSDEERNEFKDRVNKRLHERNLAQNETNRQEAKSRHWFVASWRPALGWSCVLAIGGWAIVTIALACFAVYLVLMGESVQLAKDASSVWHEFTLPVREVMAEIVMGMAGLAGLRTFEKLKGLTK